MPHNPISLSNSTQSPFKKKISIATKYYQMEWIFFYYMEKMK